MKRILITCLVILYCFAALGQSIGHNSAKTIITALDSMQKRLPIEKLYLQTDKPYYTLGDTIWFKSYLLNADYLTPSIKSGLLYVELDDMTGRVIKRIMVPVTSGISWGDMALTAGEVPEGDYTLRAYTNWMLNFGEDYIFKKNIFISALSGSTLVKANFKLDSLAGKNKVTADLAFAGLNKDPIRFKDMRLKVMNGRHNLFRDKATTGMDGGLNINFNLADKTQLKNLTILANQTGKGITDTATLIIPVTINRPEKTDVQFMPEGGNMIAGIPSRVGFKAIGEDGKGIQVSGRIIDSRQQEIVKFQSLHQGMGSFELTPQAGESYIAIINLPNKTTKSYPLPTVNPSGTALRVTPKGDDSLEVVLSLKSQVSSQKSASTQDFGLKTSDLGYYLIGQSRGVVCYAATISFKDGAVKKLISKQLFPTGIARFTLLNSAGQPLNERIVYIDKNDDLRVNITPGKPKYNLRDSIALNIHVTDKDGNPVSAIFSLAVTDAGQVRPDSLGSNIINDLLFTSDLKGTVEDPGWYFDPDSYRDATATQKVAALDNLLLTQGWVGYNWKNVFQLKPTPIQFPAEKEFTVQGKVTNVFNSPLKKTTITLLQKEPLFFMNTLTNNEGRFIFKGKRLYPTDTSYYLVEVMNKKGDAQKFNSGIDLEKFTPPVFGPPKEQQSPWYVNSDTTFLNNAGTRAAELKAQESYIGEGNMLKQVEINARKIIPDSHNLNGPGGADETYDEKDMNKAKTMTLFELLQQKYKRFYKQQRGGHTYYNLNGLGVTLVIDGYFPAPTDLYMDYLTADDIKGIEIMYSAQFMIPYLIRWRSSFEAIGRIVILEITTYSANGAFIKPKPGRYVYKPIGFSLAQQFYSPKYTVKNKNVAPGTDLRSTIYWEPNVITDKDGKATVSFFSADKQADYTVILEGTDLNGNLGYKRQQIKGVSAAAGK